MLAYLFDEDVLRLQAKMIMKVSEPKMNTLSLFNATDTNKDRSPYMVKIEALIWSRLNGTKDRGNISCLKTALIFMVNYSIKI